MCEQFALSHYITVEQPGASPMPAHVLTFASPSYYSYNVNNKSIAYRKHNKSKICCLHLNSYRWQTKSTH